MPDTAQKNQSQRTSLDVLADLNSIRKGKMPDGSTVAQRRKQEEAKKPPMPEEKGYIRRGIDYLMGWDK